MALAFTWLVQAGVLFGLTAVVRTAVRRWRRTDVRLSLVQCPSSTVARVALHALPWCAAGFGTGILVSVVGLPSVAATIIAVVAMVAFCAVCTLGILLPNLADPLRHSFERSR